MKKVLFAVMIMFSFGAFAEDQWFCKDDSAMRDGNVLSICGVALAPTEGEARKRALENAVNEFQVTCALSSDCKGHKINVDPKRSTCVQEMHQYNTVYICHRMFQFTIL